ncbi:MAG: nucleoside monophosphate kinase [Candidatus Omnitrophica bacterium]|nr:nucleoside monophosphate kinase [Candidatus Omnitrophota bacterium]MCM8828935.1 nucleoside monophosphate kinase [Candidatus Omnitrophota bacterium]
MKVVILLGPPGIGKGTVGNILSKKWNAPLISMGDLLRENVKNATSVGLKAEVFMKKGELVPDDIVFEALAGRIKQKDAENGVLMDGFPRNINQAHMLENILNDNDEIVLLNLVASNETLTERLSLRRICIRCGAVYHLKNIPPKKDGLCDICGGELIQRNDDKPEVIARRLEVFRKETEPLIKYYAGKHKMVKISAEGTPEDIIRRIEELGLWG